MFNLLSYFLLFQYRNNNYRNRPWYEELLNLFRDEQWLALILVIAIIFIIFKKNKKEYHSHWNTLIPNFKYLSKDFYSELKEELLSHEIESIKTSFVHLAEGGIGSSKRIYLRVEWKNYQYDMCCAPFGDGLFLSSWLINKTSIGHILISKIPFIGEWLARKLYKVTYFKIDTASMFMTYCHNAMLKVSDSITKEAGFRINESDRKPVLKDVFKR